MLINNDGSLVSKFSVSEAPFIVSNAKSNGYKDLIVSSKGKLHLLKYNGNIPCSGINFRSSDFLLIVIVIKLKLSY